MIAFLTDELSIRRLLGHLGLSTPAQDKPGPAAGRHGLEALAQPQATLRRLPPAAAVPCPGHGRRGASC